MRVGIANIEPRTFDRPANTHHRTTCPIAIASHDVTSTIPLSVVWHYSFACIFVLLWGDLPENWGDMLSLPGYDPIANLVVAKGLICAAREASAGLFLSRRSRRVARPGAAKGGDAFAQICP